MSEFMQMDCIYALRIEHKAMKWLENVPHSTCGAYKHFLFSFFLTFGSKCLLRVVFSLHFFFYFISVFFLPFRRKAYRTLDFLYACLLTYELFDVNTWYPSTAHTGRLSEELYSSVCVCVVNFLWSLPSLRTCLQTASVHTTDTRGNEKNNMSADCLLFIFLFERKKQNKQTNKHHVCESVGIRLTLCHKFTSLRTKIWLSCRCNSNLAFLENLRHGNVLMGAVRLMILANFNVVHKYEV